MTGSLIFETGEATHQGRVREHNEDAALALPLAGIWLVSDGVGGHEAGDVASALIVEEVASVGVPVSAQDLRARITERLARADRRIRDHAITRGGVLMGATVVVLMIHETGFVCLWAGDSRIYLMRHGRLTRLTTDHSEVQAMVDAGRLTEAEARRSPRRNVITRAIGIADAGGTEAVTGTVEPDDLFLLCSDGLTEHLEDEELALHLSQQLPAQAIAEGMIAETLARGARDNVTALVLRCLPGTGFAPDGETRA
ncbi:MAG: protein phosphatase 2C domain-containing protein [Paracoccus sp. (in: a-proteobacteria)]|nr:protein phosphatase 2C domain-containing protein [Paracoccus sp. (in: a-proteobacteria)]